MITLRRVAGAVGLLILVAAMPLAAADKPLPRGMTAEPQKKTSLNTPRHDASSEPHPLDAVLEYARREQAYLRSTVRDFTCRLIKRERIEGVLQKHQYIDMRVREELRDGDAIVQPFSLYLEFVGPPKLAGRRLLYVAGRNDDKMMVRNGGRHFDYVVVNLDPDGDTAKEESLVPVTKTGFQQILDQMIDIIARHRRVDPAGDNTKVERIAGAKLNHRACTIIRITHPRKQQGLEFHVANVFVDDELHAPARVDISTWPHREGNPAPLLAEYTYTDLKMNVNLPDAAFSAAQLKQDK